MVDRPSHLSRVTVGRGGADVALKLKGGSGDVHPRTPPPQVQIGTLGAGQHAVYRLMGPHSEIGEAYRSLCDACLPSSGEIVAERPCMKLYRNTLAEVTAEHMIPQLCAPFLEENQSFATFGTDRQHESD